MKRFIIILSMLFVMEATQAFDASKFLGKSSANVVNPNEMTPQDKANIENVVRVFTQLDANQKAQLVEYRKAYQEALEELIIRFEKLPKEVKEALKLEKNVKVSLSPKGQEELEKYINSTAKTE
jgi:hypothetical protein